jgi:hypothetical protein
MLAVFHGKLLSCVSCVTADKANLDALPQPDANKTPQKSGEVQQLFSQSFPSLVLTDDV